MTFMLFSRPPYKFFGGLSEKKILGKNVGGSPNTSSKNNYHYPLECFDLLLKQ